MLNACNVELKGHRDLWYSESVKTDDIWILTEFANEAINRLFDFLEECVDYDTQDLRDLLTLGDLNEETIVVEDFRGMLGERVEAVYNIVKSILDCNLYLEQPLSTTHKYQQYIGMIF